MAESDLSLNEWMQRVNRAKTKREIFAILDEFRDFDWTDDECSKMSKHYIRILDVVAKLDTESDTADETTRKPNGDADDGPVWYEKM